MGGRSSSMETSSPGPARRLLQLQLLVLLAHREDRLHPADVDDRHLVVVQGLQVLHHERRRPRSSLSPRGRVDGHLAQLADGLLPLVAEILLVLRDGLLVLLQRPGERLHVLRLGALLQRVDEALDGLDGLLRLAEVAVELARRPRLLVVGVRRGPRERLRRLAQMPLLAARRPGGSGPGGPRAGRRGSAHLLLRLRDLPGLLQERREVEAEVLVLAAGASSCS